ncbi:MAG: UTP--glucose-1-phosphate uridylyltransferase GalU [Deltaproteobacteria bacterium]|nr:MAG: UTP--glucose-1-phosphate uridylyltransferase GalU [Deltaproteobacteria bacterium]
MSVRKAVIPAAGLGTRFLPATKAIPKEMLPIVDVPTIQYVVDEAIASGIEHVVLVTGRGKDALVDYFDRAPELEQFLAEKGKDDLLAMVRDIAEKCEVIAIRQKEPRGLGHAVLAARPAVGDEPFAVLLGDDIFDADPPCIRQLIDVFEARKQAVIALLEVSDAQTSAYGVIKGTPLAPGLHQVEGMVEKPAPGTAPSRLAIMGRYVLPPDIFPLIAATPPGKGGEIQLTDALDRLRAASGVIGCAFRGTRYDAGDKFGYLQANLEYALKRPDLAAKLRPYLRDLVGK